MDETVNTTNKVSRYFKAGDLVRLKADPGRQGTITGKTRLRGKNVLWQVRFPDGTDYQKTVHLELVLDDDDDPVELLGLGKFGRARDLRGSITHIRLTGRLANLIYSMDTTNTDFYPYQFKPVLNFLESPSGGLLLADEVGLGKTIEAGLIWTELRSRFDIRRVLVLCPAMLREKWRDELNNRFGISADIVKPGDVLALLADFHAQQRYDYSVVCSMQGFRPRKGWNRGEKKLDAASRLARFLEECAYEEPLFDLVIVDEAHYMRNPETMTSQLGRLLRGVSEYILLLSATPIHLHNNDLFQLLNLVDEDTFSRQQDFGEILAANEPILRARDAVLGRGLTSVELAQFLEEAREHTFLENSRQIASLLETLPTNDDLADVEKRTILANRLESINLLGRAVNRTRKRDVTEWRVVREVVPEMVEMTDLENEFYRKVTEIVRDYAQETEGHEAFLSVTPQRQMSSSMPAALDAWLRKKKLSTTQLYEDFGFNRRTGELGPLTERLINSVGQTVDQDALFASDSKYARLQKMLTQYLNRHPKEKVVVFAYFRPTLLYLRRRLKTDRIDAIVLMGGQNVNKQEIIERFRKRGGPSVLLSSEVASEGVDLQFSRLLVNYDLPWNPMKVEQRIGRLDRIGQKSPQITIWNLFYKNTIDERIYKRLYERLDIFKRALGDLEAVLGDEIRKLTEDLLFGKLTPEQEEERIEQTEAALSFIKAQEERLEAEAGNLVAHGDYILNQIRAAREMQRTITREDLWNYVYDFFTKEYTGSEFTQLKTDELLFDTKLSDDAKYRFGKFLDQNQLQGTTVLANAFPRRFKCRFDNQVGRQRLGREETINQYHPLIRFVSDQIQRSGFKYYSPVSVEVHQSEIPKIKSGAYTFAVEQWSVKGIRDIEKLHVAAREYPSGVSLKSDLAEKLVTVAARVGRDWTTSKVEMDLSVAVEQIQRCFETSEHNYENYIQQIDHENNDRADVQEKALRKHHKRQLERLEELLNRYIAERREKIIPATRGRIDALNARVSQKLLEIEEGRNLKHSKREVCIGLVNVI